MFKHILFPTEYSEFSEKALEFTLKLVEVYQSRLSILYVIPDYGIPAVEDFFPETPKHEDKKEGYEKFKSMIAQKVPSGIEYDIIKISGRPFESVLYAADELHNDLIVLASRDEEGIVHHLLGTNAGKVAKRAKCSVMLFKPEMVV